MTTSPDDLYHYVCHLTKQPWSRSSFADGRSSEFMCKHCNARSLTAQLNMSGIEGGSLLDAICNVSPSLWQIGLIKYKTHWWQIWPKLKTLTSWKRTQNVSYTQDFRYLILVETTLTSPKLHRWGNTSTPNVSHIPDIRHSIPEEQLTLLRYYQYTNLKSL